MLLLVVEVIDSLMLFYLIAFSAMQDSVFRRRSFINKSKVHVWVCACLRVWTTEVSFLKPIL